ncbi:hypothetical protein COY95_04895, partial [Candidatus Woesearchaeota archaeon CG_4_10_14_0_8_um_filter_47_5]
MVLSVDLLGRTIEVGNEIGIYSFAAVAVLILVYLLRPKPFKQVIPSLIFIEKSTKSKSLFSFFRSFIKDPLFFLQLLTIL